MTTSSVTYQTLKSEITTAEEDDEIEYFTVFDSPKRGFASNIYITDHGDIYQEQVWNNKCIIKISEDGTVTKKFKEV